jgi:replication-associated recombination protein RarA
MPESPKPPRVTGLGQPFDVAVSALQKEIRRGDERAGVYWALQVYQIAPGYCWRRVLITAAEDVGLAAPEVVAQVGALHQMHLAAFTSKSSHHLTMAVMLLCRAPKSTAVEDLQSLTLEGFKAGVLRPILPEHQDGHTRAGRARGATWKDWYRDRHVKFEIPVNAYTRELWRLRPEWRPDEIDDSSAPLEPGESPP